MKPKILASGKSKIENYIKGINDNGGEAFASYLPEYSPEYDGLLLCGGVDINPALYGEDVNGAVNIDDDRDRAEYRLIEKFLKAGKPIFGICRGCQMINVYFGGSLYQELNTGVVHRADETPYHEVSSVYDGKLKKIYGESITVNSFHHQSVKKLADGFDVSYVSGDGVIEAIEHKTLPIFAVQWHPERMLSDSFLKADGNPLFAQFIKACK